MITERPTKTYVLKRSGSRPLKFSGRLISSVEGRFSAGKEQTRYFDLSLYRTADGKFVVQVEYTTCWQDEQCRSYCDTGEDGGVLEMLLWEAWEECIGGSRFTSSPDKIDTLRGRYKNAISELLSHEEFAEQI